MYSLIVKGNRSEALAAAEAHDVEVSRVHYAGEHESTLIGRASIVNLVSWFCEAGFTLEAPRGGFNAGTLLAYRELLPAEVAAESRDEYARA